MAADAELKQDVARLSAAVARIEDRLAAIERHAGRRTEEVVGPPSAESPDPIDGEGEDLENRIGELWIGQAGVVALLIGIAFFVVYPFGKTFPAALQSLIGYLAITGFYLLSQRLRSSSPTTSRVLFSGGLILLYFCTLRLHFFNDVPLIANRTVALILLLGVLALVLRIAVVRRSSATGVMAVLLICVTGLTSDTSHFAMVLFLLAAATSAVLWLRFGWGEPILVSVVTTYTAHLVWMFNNPVVGHPVRVLADHHNSLIYLLAYAAAFSAGNFRRGVDANPASFVFGALNAMAVLGMGMLVGMTYFPGEIWAVALSVSALLLSVASALWVVRHGVLSTAVYACIGYLALTIAIVDYFDSPARFVWLGWQSLLVISMAIWFRSRLVVVGNVAIYLGILLYYLMLETPEVAVNLSYAAVALLSARIMNWQKERLDLTTEKMRNVYLASAFVIVPYGLHHGVPAQFASLAWLGAALFYFGLSILLSNSKYRWMAIITLFLAAVRLVVVDLANLNPALRMVSFLVLGLCLIAISFLYSRRRAAHDAASVRGPGQGG